MFTSIDFKMEAREKAVKIVAEKLDAWNVYDGDDADRILISAKKVYDFLMGESEHFKVKDKDD